MTDLLDEALAAHLGRSLYDTINQHLADGQRAEAERDGAYRERAHLLAWLATLHPAVITLAPDVDEPGWKLLFINASGWQLSWHIAPRDAELFAHVEHVAGDDPRAQWDGHTTDQKYERIRQLAALGGPGPDETDTTPAEPNPYQAAVARARRLANRLTTQQYGISTDADEARATIARDLHHALRTQPAQAAGTDQPTTKEN